MKIKVKQNILSKLLETANRAVDNKSELFKFINIIAVAANNKVIFNSMNNFLTISQESKCVVEEEGNICIDASVLNNLVKKYPADAEIEFFTEENKLNIKCKRSKASLALIDREFPKFNNSTDNKNSVQIKEENFKTLLNSVLYASAITNERPALQSELIEINKDLSVATSVALDGYRLALKNIRIENASSTFSMLLPREAIVELIKILESTEKIVDISCNTTIVQIKIAKDNFTIVMNIKLVQEKFIEYSKIIPSAENMKKVTIDTECFTDAIERAALVNQKDNLIKFVINNNLSIQSNGQIGKVNEEVECISNINEKFTIAFNGKYVLEALKNIENKTINLFFDSNVSPSLIMPEKEKEIDFISLLLPVRIANQ